MTVIDMLPLADIRAREKAIARAHRLAEAEGVRFRCEFRLKAITPAGVVGEDGDGRVSEIACDTVALSLGVRPRRDAAEALAGVCEETVFVGDCALRQGNILSAVRDGFYAAMNV